jgi:DNA-binding CsgD family transcriptional regulator
MASDSNKDIMIQYSDLLNELNFDETELDYSIVEYHKSLLERLDVTGTSCISIFDLFRKQHIYLSKGYSNILGLDFETISKHPEKADTDSLMHPEDTIQMTIAGMHFLRIAFQLPVSEKKQAKLIAEYRILNKKNEYIRVIEQFQAIELDKRGNPWLALCFMDISPNQEADAPFRCKAINHATNEIWDWKAQSDSEARREVLTRRESEILGLVAEGMMSKEIASKLFISIHTVNTHRQRILEKLGADNSQEAIAYAKKLDLIS